MPTRAERIHALAERIHALFQGSEHSHGTYATTATLGSTMKVEMRQVSMVPGPATLTDWENHLDGTKPLGIAPIRTDNTIVWAAVDIDRKPDKPVDHYELAKILENAGIQALVCRTKSGGAHVYVFFSEPVPAERIIPGMHRLAQLLGWPGSEIFPKQLQHPPLEPHTHASWLNMPYYDMERGDRICVRADRRERSVDSFIIQAENARYSLAQFNALRLTKHVEEFDRGPPCLEQIASEGLGQGQRNDGMMGFAVLARKMSPDSWSWPGLIRKWNTQIVQPPLPADELNEIIKNAGKAKYHYRCANEPLLSRCKVAVCRLRPFGVSDGEDGGRAEEIAGLKIIKTDPPEFAVKLTTGEEVVCRTTTLFDSHLFMLAAYAQHLKVLPQYSRKVWIKTIEEITKDAVIETPDTEISPEARLREALTEFVVELGITHESETIDTVLSGKAFVDGTVVWFRLKDFKAHLDKQKFDYPYGEDKSSWVNNRLSKIGGRSKLKRINGGKPLSLYVVPSDLFDFGGGKLNTPETDPSPF
jgi:hypothetical protein